MAENKTKPTEVQPADFIGAVENDRRRQDALELMALMAEITGEEARMWGPSIVGFGTYHYKYESGREGDFLQVGFSPRKANMVCYIMLGFSGYRELMDRLGKYKTGKSCLYINKLDDIDRAVLRELIEKSVADLRQKYGL
ncbi:MAG: DUF1801 domain-containing protein [Alphaproteobacteria bacterium]|nr:DUF1801 domain-containing protein [Alphaproteobacteria bacterium]